MPTLETVDPEIQYVMFTGEPGLRKSTQALSYPGPQYWFSWDQKMQALMIPMRKWGIDPKNIFYDDYKDWDAARARLVELQTNCWDKASKTKFKTLVFDSITSCADMILRQSMRQKVQNNEGKKIGTIPVNSVEDYNAETAALNDLIGITKDIHVYHKVNIILIAHVMEVTHTKLNGDSTISRSIVTAGKRVAAKLPAYCTEVYHFHLKPQIQADKGGDYAIFTEHTGDDFARTALNLPKQIVLGEDPLYSKHIKPAIDKLKNG